GVLNAGSSYTVTQTVNLPDGITGDYHLIVETDTNNNVNEFLLEGDNVTVSAGTFHVNLAAYPDPKIESLSTTAPHPNRAFTVNWNTANRGNADATGSWQERVVVTNLTTGLTAFTQTYTVNGPLAAGATLPHSQSVTVGAAGNYQVSVTTDSANQVFESNA